MTDNNVYSQIKSLFDELDYYEKQGYYKLADQIQNKIKKVAYDFEADKDLYKGMGDRFQALKIQYACEIPECMEFFCGGGGQGLITEELSNFLARNLEQNPEADVKNLIALHGKQNAQSANFLINLGENERKKLNICYKKLGFMGKNQGNTALAGGTAPQTIQGIQGNRELPPQM